VEHVTDWLRPLLAADRSAATAKGFGAVFTLMLTSLEAGRLDLFREQDDAWATVIARDIDRFDDLQDVVAESRSELLNPDEPEVEERRSQVNRLRVLRAVYRFGLLAFALDPGVEDIRQRRDRNEAASFLGAHFADQSILTFVAGAAIEVAHDPRLAWQAALRRRRSENESAATNFQPALVATFVALLLDLPPQPLLPEVWMEENEILLVHALQSVEPLSRRVAWPGAGPVTRELDVDERRAAAEHEIHDAIRVLNEERLMRVRRQPVDDRRVQQFKATVSERWRDSRVLVPVLQALGAPVSGVEATSVLLVEASVPKAAFVDEARLVSLRSHALNLGSRAARAEDRRVVMALIHEEDEDDKPDERRRERDAGLSEEFRKAMYRDTEAELRDAYRRSSLATRVRGGITQLKEAGLTPSLVLTANDWRMSSNIGLDASRIADDRRALEQKGLTRAATTFVRGRIGNALVVALPGMAMPDVILLDVTRAITLGTHQARSVAIALAVRDVERAAAEIEASDPGIEPADLMRRVNELLDVVPVSVSADLAFRVEDRSAAVVIT
jgi:hypothetical protein